MTDEFKNLNQEKMNALKDNYMNIVIPKELEKMINNTIKDSQNGQKNKYKFYKRGSAVAAAVVLAFGISVNAIPSFAGAISDIPILGSVSKVLQIANYTMSDSEKNAEMNIKAPGIDGLENKNLENSINQEYSDQAKSLYKEFTTELGNVPKGEMLNKAVDAGYEVVVNNGKLLVIKNYVTKIAASGQEVVRYKTLDVEKEQLLTLPSLFKDDGYISLISQNIKEQMKVNTESNSASYFTDEEAFDKITADANFFINQNGKLVVSFDEYEIAPGFMGVPQFEIPSDILKSVLVSNEYVK